MRKWLLVLMLGVLFVFPSFASAQDQIVIETVNVDFWPEYDRADMLVINYIALGTDVVLPVTFDFRIPVAAGSPYTVAVGPTFDVVTDQGVKYTTKEDGEWLVVSIEVTGPAIQVEYYDPGLKKNGKSRSYTYQWLSDYKVKAFSAVLQKPFDASAFKSSLTLKDDGVHADALQYFTARPGELAAGKAFSFDINYEKPSDMLSASQLKVEPVNPVDTETPGRVSFNNYLPYVLGGFGALLIIGGVVYYLQAGKTGTKKSRRRARAKPDDEEVEGDVYCAQCGTRARSHDRFCRVCGSRIKQQGE